MKLSRPSVAVASVALALAVACSSCGGSSTPSVATVRTQLLAIVKNTDNALKKDTVQKNLPGSNAKYSQAFALAARQFKALQVPASARQADDALAADLDTMSKQALVVSKAAAKSQSVEKNVLAYGEANLKLMEEEKSEKVASNALRKAIGLPPEATSTTTSQPPADLNSPTG